MNKGELVEEVANQTGLTRRQSREAVDAIISTITNSLSREEKVTLVGFGTFRVIKRQERRGRNPQTGQEIQISAKYVVRFRPGRALAPGPPSPPPP